MIKSKRDLNFYLSEDAKQFNLTNWIKYHIKLIYGSEDAHILRYLRLYVIMNIIIIVQIIF